MPNPLPDASGLWAITEEDAAFRIVDKAGKTVAEIPFDHRSPANVSRAEAKRMAEDMLAAGERLNTAASAPNPIKTSSR